MVGPLFLSAPLYCMPAPLFLVFCLLLVVPHPLYHDFLLVINIPSLNNNTTDNQDHMHSSYENHTRYEQSYLCYKDLKLEYRSIKVLVCRDDHGQRYL